ncbi:MAG: hypothetical protein WA324_27190, partial [Bryobacteraceae bacterium]
MTLLPKAHDFLPPTKSTGRPASSTKTSLRRAVSATLTPDLLAIAAFCLIGLLSSLNMILRFPDLAAVIEQYN